MFRLGRFVRTEIVMDVPPPRTVVPIPQRSIYQQGNLVLERVDDIAAGGEEIVLPVQPDGSVDLGDGHVLRPTAESKIER